MTDQWEIVDLYKALFAIAAGLILGLERELKDKAAGLKTITVICLGSALFAILSEKLGGPEGESTRIASYIVSGVGFLGAGVIFKDGVNVSGLTTAGIIWLAAAVGTSIGFGEFYLAGIFVAAALITIYASYLINIIIPTKKQTRTLVFSLDRCDVIKKDQIIAEISERKIPIEEKKLEMQEGKLIVSVEAVLSAEHMKWLETYLASHPEVCAFSL